MYCLNKKGKKEAVLGNAKSILPKLLIFLLLVFSLNFGLVTSESTDNLLEASKQEVFFDIKIIDFESPMELGEFFEFTYLVRGMADINEDIEINFWIEKQGEVVTSGSDTIYIGDFEEKIETTKIFLPKSVESGVYDFIVQVVYEGYEAQSHRTIEIEIKKGIARIITAEGKVLNTYLISVLVGLAIFILSLIFYLERRKIKKQFLQGERWIKKYKTFVLTLCLFVTLGILIYYLDFFDGIMKQISKIIFGLRTTILPYLIAPSFYYILGVIFIFIVLIFLIILIKKKKLFKKLGHWQKEKKIEQTKRDKVLEKKYKARVKESKIKFKKISKSQNRIIKKLASSLKIINPLRLIKFLLSFLKKNIILFVRLIKKFKIKKKHKVVKIVKKRKKPKKLKKKRRFFGKMLNSLKKIKIKFPKKPKKKEKLIKIKKAPEKQKKLKVPQKLKFKKVWVRIRRIVNRLGITTRKSFRFFKKKSKSSSQVLSKETKNFKKKKKKLLKHSKRKINKIYKSTFKYLNKIFGQKSSGKILQEFENTFIKTGKFTQKHLKTLKEIMNSKMKFEKKEWEKEMKEHKLNFNETIDELGKNARDLISDLVRYSKEHRKSVLKEDEEKVRKTKTGIKKFGKFFKKKSKSSKVFVSKKTNQISRQEKKIAKKAKKELKKTYKRVFKLLKKIFGRKSQKKIVREFEKSVIEAKKFSEQSLATLKKLIYRKKEIKRKKLDFSKVNELRKNAEDLIKELTSYLNKLISGKKKRLKF